MSKELEYLKKLTKNVSDLVSELELRLWNMSELYNGENREDRILYNLECSVVNMEIRKYRNYLSNIHIAKVILNNADKLPELDFHVMGKTTTVYDKRVKLPIVYAVFKNQKTQWVSELMLNGEDSISILLSGLQPLHLYTLSPHSVSYISLHDYLWATNNRKKHPILDDIFTEGKNRAKTNKEVETLIPLDDFLDMQNTVLDVFNRLNEVAKVVV